MTVIRYEKQARIRVAGFTVERVTLEKRSVLVDEDVSVERRWEQVDLSRHGPLSEFRGAA